MNWSILLPWPPSLNAYYRHVVVGGKPRTLIAEKGRHYRLAVVATVLQHHRPSWPLGARLAVSVLANPPTKRVSDLDNLWKGLLDACTHARVWPDDSVIDDLHIRRGGVVPGGRLALTVHTLEVES